MFFDAVPRADQTPAFVFAAEYDTEYSMALQRQSYGRLKVVQWHVELQCDHCVHHAQSISSALRLTLAPTYGRWRLTFLGVCDHTADMNSKAELYHCAAWILLSMRGQLPRVTYRGIARPTPSMPCLR